MKKAEVYQLGELAGWLEQTGPRSWRFQYISGYASAPVSLSMPVTEKPYDFSDRFPPAFEGLLPEGVQLDALLRVAKLDAKDCFGQLMAVGEDVVGSLTFREL